MAHCLADERMLKVLAALRLYQLDHKKMPGQLSELVPKYLSTLPLDPIDDAPLRYDASQAEVYSIGLRKDAPWRLKLK